MSKQDRQGVRKASDLEQKYNLGLIGGGGSKTNTLPEQLNKINQSFAQFSALIIGRFESLERKIDGLTLDYVVTFVVDEEVYEAVNVKAGNSVNAPAAEPTSESGTFVSWQLDGKDVEFPYTPTADAELVALFE